MMSVIIPKDAVPWYSAYPFQWGKKGRIKVFEISKINQHCSIMQPVLMFFSIVPISSNHSWVNSELLNFFVKPWLFNPLSANPTKWWNTTNCLSVFDHFVGLALTGLICLMFFFFAFVFRSKKLYLPLVIIKR